MELKDLNSPRLDDARHRTGQASSFSNRNPNRKEFPFSTEPPICSCGEAAWKDDFGYCERCGRQLPKAAA